MIDIVVLIPHYNDLEGLYDAVKSIQYNGSLEFIIVDDGSEWLPNREYLQTITKHDFHILELKTNQGIDKALNTGLEYITSNITCKYIARMDCGDICLSGRLTVQKEFLDENDHIALVGSWVEFVDEKGTFEYKLEFPTKHPEIVKQFPKAIPFMHPAVLFRSEVIHKIGYYPTKYPAAEDYAFFFKIVKAFETANIPQVLMQIRLRDSGISIRNRRRQLKSRLLIVLHNWEYKPWFLFGAARVMALFILPRSLTEWIKRKFWT